MARAAILFAILSLLAVAATACNVPPGGCHVTKVCQKLVNLEKYNITEQNFRKYSLIGYFKGMFNSQGGKVKPQKPGSGPLNLEIFQEVGNFVEVVTSTKGNTLAKCCAACAKSLDCYEYHFFVSPRMEDNTNVKNFRDGVQCYLLQKNAGSGVSGGLSHPYAGDRKEQAAMAPYFPLSWVGGLCNGKATVENDPHLTGAHGTHFDFTGRLNKAFCLLSDERVHINMLLDGYQGTPPAVTAGAVAAASAAAAAAAPSTGLHTWIKEVGVVWVSGGGKQHSLRMVARTGNQQDRGSNGFLALMQVDGADVAPPRLMEEAVEAEGGVVVSKVAEGREGPFDVDRYTVSLEGVGELDVRMRVAHPLLQTPEEAEAHFNIALTDIVSTRAVHGVLGQTFRDTPEQQSRALRYTHLSALLHHPIAADQEEGRGFLDGSVEDYVSSGITAPDCRFSAFAGRQGAAAVAAASGAAGVAGAGAGGAGAVVVVGAGAVAVGAGADGEDATEDVLASVV
ncbi:unnamed protein product [Closterium sp. Naga37s-1]|nr:unnamed protein product [Closterium sp. Naga37s-1]